MNNADGTRSFWSTDPLVPKTALRIENEFPGELQSVNKKFYRSDGTDLTDTDLLLPNKVVEVKSGKHPGQNWEQQMQNIKQATGLPIVVYGPRLGWKIRARMEQLGIRVVRTEDELINELKR